MQKIENGVMLRLQLLMTFNGNFNEVVELFMDALEFYVV